MCDQDWEPVVIRKKGAGTAFTASRQSTVSTGKSPQISQAAAVLRKVANSESVKPRQLSTDARKELTQRRVAMGKTQVQLNADCNFGLNVIRDVESGKYCPQPQQLSILNRVLRSNVKYEV